MSVGATARTLGKIEFKANLTVQGSLWVLELLSEVSERAKETVFLGKDLYDFSKARVERKVFLDWLLDNGLISVEKHRVLSDTLWAIMATRGEVNLLRGEVEESLPFWEDIVHKFIGRSLPGLDVFMGAAIYEHQEGELPQG